MMPSLVLSSRFTTDSQRLRETARQLGWETLRLDGDTLPDWFDPPDEQVALFYTAPHAFDIANQLSRSLLGCQPGWLLELPAEFRQREIRQMKLADALELDGCFFVKHALSKAFPAAVMDARELAGAAHKLSPNALVHVAEPVVWTAEYRAFVADDQVRTIAAYHRDGRICEQHEDLDASPVELAEAREYAQHVLDSPAVRCPPAFVLDVGTIAGRGWAVVEPNECWAAGIYSCEPGEVLACLLRACVPVADDRWGFERHYCTACPPPL